MRAHRRGELPRQLEGGSPLLAGRDRELRWLRKRWQEAEAGRTSVALVSGPPGIGKTRLAAELAAEVQHRGGGALRRGLGRPRRRARGDPRRGGERASDPARARRRRRRLARPARGRGRPRGETRRITSSPPRPSPRRAGPAGVRRRGAEACASPPAGGGRRRDRRALRAGRRHCDAGRDADGR